MQRYRAATDDKGHFVLDTQTGKECFKMRTKTEAEAATEAEALNRLYAGWMNAARSIFSAFA